MPKLLRAILILNLSLAAIPAAFTQTSSVVPRTTATAGPASFDIISIHEHDPKDRGRNWRSTPDGVTGTNITLQNLVCNAFDVKFRLVFGGAPWTSSTGFDIAAKVIALDWQEAVKLTEDQRAALLQALLADRFHLKAHVETKTLPIYELVVAKGGPKMTPTPPGPATSSTAAPPPTTPKPKGSSQFGPGRFQAYGYPVALLAEQLGYLVDRDVIDKTGLLDSYDFTLEWNPDEQFTHPDNAADPRPDIFTALQEQLGLKLVSAKGPIRTLFIDHAEHPTAN